jgi:DNA-binding transcriptional MerR regulator
MAKAFGSDDIQINRKEVINENSNQIVRQNDNVEKTLELIKELRALGFSPEEIKQEIQIRFR